MATRGILALILSDAISIRYGTSSMQIFTSRNQPSAIY